MPDGTLLDAIRALSEFEPPAALPPCDPTELAQVLEAHGLAPLASYQLENRRIGADAPEPLREKLLTLYQGIANDNVYKILTLRELLEEAGKRADSGFPVVLLEATAYIDWIYPHLAFRPVGDLRLAVRAEDAPAFADAAAALFQLERTGPGGHTATFTNGKVPLEIQEGLVRGSADPAGLFERSRPYPAFGPLARRPSLEDALLGTVAGQADLGLRAPLMTYLDLRELVRLGPDRALVHSLASRTRLERALYGALTLCGHFFPTVADAALALRPPLSGPERFAVEAVVDAARDPANLRALRGAEAAARLVVAP